jgi:single-strand DNA-binding protein
MINQMILVGRLVDNPLLEETENGKNTATIMLAVPRAFKNDNGEYKTDFIPVSLVGQVASSVNEYCKKGNLVGIRGRVARLSNTSEIQIIAEKATFLSNK